MAAVLPVLLGLASIAYALLAAELLGRATLGAAAVLALPDAR